MGLVGKGLHFTLKAEIQNITFFKTQHINVPGSDLLADLESLPERQEATGTPVGAVDASGSYFGELGLP